MGTRNPHEGKQRGFFLSQGDSVMRLRPQDGDEMVGRQEERRRRRGRTPFQEVLAYEQALRDWEDGVGDHRLENVNGAVDQVKVGRHHTTEHISGEGGAVLYRHDPPASSPLPELSPAAKALLWARRKEAAKKGD
ncbi:hypothetical protein HY339_00340 [Candidatus Gottesmanbacteria bacterium]|nr:hypothetical protein [Candidatus Gottesmanbacteria bacterium]